MKMIGYSHIKRIGFLLALVMLAACFQKQNVAFAASKAPVLSEDEIELVGVGDEHQLEVLNKKAKSKYKWTSSNEAVATVSENGLVTAVNKGTAKIKCKITYSTGTVKNLYCYVTVSIPAEKIEINNAKDSNGTHIMRVGETYNFNRTLTPSNSTDKTYWSIDASDDEANPDAIAIVNSSNGIVKALRGGKIVLVATAAKEATAKAAKKSIVKDAIIIEVVGPAAEVVSAQIVNAKTIKVVFGTAIRPSTVINSNGSLSSNITVTPKVSSKGETAKNPGTLTGSISSDNQTLTITASSYFYGEYGISFSDGILTADGTKIYKDYFNMKYMVETPNTGTDYPNPNTEDPPGQGNTIIDTDAPKLASVELDDDGMTNIITFTEPMDFTYFSVGNATSGSTGVQASTISYLNTKANYIFSADKKSIMINLTDINPLDYNKAFTVTISGVTDTSGNRLANGSVVVGLVTNTAPREQARPISVVRSSYDTITATFTRSIKTPGYARINQAGYYPGEVNPENDRQVIYKMYSYEASLSGTQTVSIGYWNSYNVSPSDTYANRMYDFSVYFTVEQVRPIITSYQYNPNLRILTLTFSEDVTLLSNTGYLSYSMDSSSQYGNTGTLYYTLVSRVNNVVELMLHDMTLYGNYTLTLQEGFALDNFRNKSYSKTITINNGTGSGSTRPLAEPYSIIQSASNHSLIYIDFAEKLDETTALDIDNYYIAGVTINEVKLISNTTNGAQVRLTLEKGTITANGARKMTITGLRGYNGSASVMADYTTTIELIENKDPELVSVKYNAQAKNVIDLTFSEEVKGNMTLTVRERATGAVIGSTVSIEGKVVKITLGHVPNDGTYLNLYVQYNGITDLNGNESTIDPVLYAFVNY